jgi:putative oxidoreductase
MANDRPIRNVDLVPLFIRLALAVVFIYHGYAKVFQGGHGFIAELMAGKMAVPKDTFVPQLLGWLAAVTEFFGGIFLGLGLLSRIWGLGQVILMAVAIATVTGTKGFGSLKGGYEYNFVLMVMAGAILFGGPGAFSLDRLIFRPRKKTP